MSGTESLLKAVSGYKDKMAGFNQEIAEERRQHRAKIDILNRALDRDFAELEREFEAFFENADIEVFTRWETAGPIYEAAWNDRKVSQAFLTGFRRLLGAQDTYLSSGTVPLLDKRPLRGGTPMVDMTVMIPAVPEEGKLRRTSELVEKLFAPMVDVVGHHYVSLILPPTVGNGYIAKSAYEGADYDLYTPERGGRNPDFSGTMAEVFGYIAEFLAPAGVYE